MHRPDSQDRGARTVIHRARYGCATRESDDDVDPLGRTHHERCSRKSRSGLAIFSRCESGLRSLDDHRQDSDVREREASLPIGDGFCRRILLSAIRRPAIGPLEGHVRP